MNSCLKMKRKAKEEAPFMKNGGLLLEELIAFCNGKSNPIHVFSAEDLRRETNNYDTCQRFLDANSFVFYMGSLEGCLISVKKYKGEFLWDFEVEDTIKDSGWKANECTQKCSKTLSICFESNIPILVYEFVGDRILSTCIHPVEGVVSEPLPWKCRLSIAMGIANAVTYLH